MTTINLLPWREELRKINNKIFFAFIFVSITSGLFIVLFAHFLFRFWINVELDNITLLRDEQKKVLRQIQEIRNLQRDKAEFLRQREIIQTLEESRSLSVRFLDAIPRVTPENIVLTSIERKGSQVIIFGTAETPSAISKFYNALEDPSWNKLFKDIKINEMALKKKQTGLGFKLEFILSNFKAST